MPCLVAAVGVLFAATGTRAQDDLRFGEPTAVVRNPPLVDDQPPAPEHAMRAYRTVDRWVRGWSVSAWESERLYATAACVTLRFGGEIVGRGTAVSSDALGPDAGNDGASVLARATQAALNQAGPRLPAPNDALRDDALRQLSSDIAIGIELAGRFTPFESATWGEVDERVAPGLEGVSVERPGAATDKAPGSVVFPSAMLTRSMTPSAAMRSAAALAIGEGGAAAALDQPPALRERFALRTARFRTTQLNQAHSKAEPAFLYRGAGALRVGAVTSRAELMELARALEANLRRRAVPHTGRAQGANADSKTSSISGLRIRASAGTRPSDQEAATRAGATEFIALHAITESEILAGADPEEAIGVRSDAKRLQDHVLLTRLAELSNMTDADIDATEIVAVWLASRGGSCGAIGAPATDTSACGCGGDLCHWLLQRKVLSPRPVYQVMLDRVAGPSKAMGVLATTYVDGSSRRCVTIGPQEVERRADDAGAVTGALLLSTSPSELPSLMPWVGFAESAIFRFRETAARYSPFDERKNVDFPFAIRFREMRDLLWRSQLTAEQVSSDKLDMLGGVAMTSASGSPLPTWQCLRPLAFVATMLREPRLTEPQERSRELVRLLAAAGYLRRLMVDDNSVWMYPDPVGAMGGVRASVWDPSLPTDATSMGLLFVVELIRSLDALAAEQFVGPPKPDAGPKPRPVVSPDP